MKLLYGKSSSYIPCSQRKKNTVLRVCQQKKTAAKPNHCSKFNSYGELTACHAKESLRIHVGWNSFGGEMLSNQSFCPIPVEVRSRVSYSW